LKPTKKPSPPKTIINVRGETLDINCFIPLL
jgi:hypothetical protein